MSAELKQPALVLLLKFPVQFPLPLSSLTPTGFHLHSSTVTKKALDSTL